MTWTLWLLLLLPNGDLGLVEQAKYTTEQQCHRAEAYVIAAPIPESMRLVATACKLTIDV